MTEKEYKKKHRKFRKDKGKEMKKSSVVWNFFHKDPEDKTKTICQICFKVLLFSGSNGSMLTHLRHHKVLQEDDEEIPCSECGKILKNKAALKRHEKIVHFDTDRFVCSYCPKAFYSNSKRLIHERIHTGEKPYQVPFLINIQTSEAHNNRIESRILALSHFTLRFFISSHF